MVTTAIRPPSLVSSRPVAHDLLSGIPDDLHDAVVRVEFDEVLAAAPSFVDELVRVVLVDRRAVSLELVGIAPRTAAYARRSAETHDVAARLAVTERG